MAAAKTNPTLYLVDAHSLIFQVFHALPEMSSPSGLPTNALFGFTKDMLYLRTERKPDYLVVAFDVAGPTFRDKLFADYKANRSPMPDDLSLQIPLIYQMLEAMRIPVVGVEGYEADDVIATLACAGAERDMAVYICSSDKDCRQLLNEHVQIFNLRKREIFDVKRAHAVNALPMARSFVAFDRKIRWMPPLFFAALHRRRHLSELGAQAIGISGPVAPAPRRADEPARFVERQRGDVVAEVAPQAVLHQILLDIRQVKRRHDTAFFLQVLSDRADCLGPREVADDRHEQILRLQIFQERELLFARQITAHLPVAVGRGHQVRICRLTAATEAVAAR